MKFGWYVTTLRLDDMVLNVCLDMLKTNSSQNIHGILIPLHEFVDRNMPLVDEYRDVPVTYVDTTKKGLKARNNPGRSWVKRNKKILRINEEHYRLLGHGVQRFPSCIIDADMWMIDNTIDSFIWSKRDGCLKHRSSCLYLHTSDEKWTWDMNLNCYDEDIKKSFKYSKDVPFVHILSAMFLKHQPRRYWRGMHGMFSFLSSKGYTKEYFTAQLDKFPSRDHLRKFL